MKRGLLLPGLLICCLVFALWVIPFSEEKNDDSLMLTSDALNPINDLLKPYTDGKMQRVDPYQFAENLPGYEGMALVFDTQAHTISENNFSTRFMPLYSATIVIAINKKSGLANAITGWESLLKSSASLCIPFYNTEDGRLAAIAFARGLGAKEGDISPAVDIYARLKSEERLNNMRTAYNSENYKYMYDIDELDQYDAVILWDYQAHALNQTANSWDIVIPVEGALTVNCGILYNEEHTNSALLKKIENLSSDEGRTIMKEAGFSPVAAQTDLTAWNSARIFFGPAFRRQIIEEKQYSPASLYERMFLQTMILLMFCIAARLILRRFPQGPYRSTSAAAMAFVLLWLLTGIIKTLSFNEDVTRYWWFASYIPRHFLPVCWYFICHLAAFGKLPPKKTAALLAAIAVLLSAAVMSNDLHNWFFIYLSGIPTYWYNDYTYGGGYYLSLFWTIALIFAGAVFLIRMKKTRQQKRQLVFAGALMAVLITYQVLYMIGIKYIIDLDIPTTVAIAVLLFLFAVQKERFMGASLLALPVFHDSPYALAVLDPDHQVAYSNAAMKEIMQSDPHLSAFADVQDGSTAEAPAGKKTYNVRKYIFGNNKALLLEDITYMKKVEHELEETRGKLDTVRIILTRLSQDTRRMAEKTEQEHYLLQMNRLFISKIKEIKNWLPDKQAELSRYNSRSVLLHARLLIYICQHRLRFMIRSAEMHSSVKADQIKEYVSCLVRDANRIGLDGAVTGTAGGLCPARAVLPLLEAIDRIILFAHACPGTSLVCHMEADGEGLWLNALVSWEGSDTAAMRQNILPEKLEKLIVKAGGKVLQQIEEDCVLVKLSFQYREVT